MKTGLGGFIRDLDLRTKSDQFVESTLLCRPRVHARDDPHLPASKKELRELRADKAQSSKADESTEQVHTVRALDLECDLGSDLQILVPVDQKRAVSQWN